MGSGVPRELRAATPGRLRHRRRLKQSVGDLRKSGAAVCSVRNLMSERRGVIETIETHVLDV